MGTTAIWNFWRLLKYSEMIFEIIVIDAVEFHK